MSERPAAVSCRFCRGTAGALVLDLGRQPASDLFPAGGDPASDPLHPLQMWLCEGCGLAQLVDDPTTPEEPRGLEPEAMVRQARDAVACAAWAGLLEGATTVREFGSPHGGSWLELLAEHGLREQPPDTPADVVIDCIGIMHEADQQRGLRERIDAVAPGGVLLVEFHTFAAIVEGRQWNALRHGHFAYYSVTAMVGMLESVGFKVTHGFWFELYGGTVMLAARRRGDPGPHDQASVDALLAEDARIGVTEPTRVREIDQAARWLGEEFRRHLVEAHDAGRRVAGYGAASRAVPLLHRAGIGGDLLPLVADAAPSKVGRRMPGTEISIVAPQDLIDHRPDEVVLFVTDLLDDVRAALPAIEASGGRWVIVDPAVIRVEPLEQEMHA